MKKIVIATAIILTSFGLVACEPGYNTPGATAVGVVAGGLLGGAAFHGHPGGIIAGALIGGVVGHAIGRSMDRQDRINMEQAIIHTPVDEEASWENEDSGATYVVRPVREGYVGRRYCREYRTTVTIGGKVRRAFGKACRMPDGSWKIIS